MAGARSPTPAGEDERVDAAERCGHRTDSGPQAVEVDIECELGVFIARVGAGENLAHVGRSGQAHEPDRGVNRSTAQHGGQRGAGTEVAGDYASAVLVLLSSSPARRAA